MRPEYIESALQDAKDAILFEQNQDLATNYELFLAMGGQNEQALADWNAATYLKFLPKLARIPTQSLVISSRVDVDQVAELPVTRDIRVTYSDAPWQIIYGEVKNVRGLLSFITTDIDAGGEWLHYVLTIAAHELEHVDTVYFDEVEFTHGEGSAWEAAWGSGEWENYAFVSQRTLGATDQAANSDLIAQSDALFPGKWTSNHRQQGRAHIYIINYYYPSRFPYGFPDVTFHVRGKKVFDPRDGGQSFDDPSTWTYSNNAALCIADFLTDSAFGCGVPSDQIDWDNVEAAADVCDEDVTLADSSTEKRYTINGTFTSDRSRDEIRRYMAQAIAGDIVFSGGKWRIFPGKWRSPTLELTDDDLRGAAHIRLKTPRSETFNAVKGTYVSPEHGWEVTDYPLVKNDTYEEEDGERIYREIPQLFVTSPATCQRIAKIELERVRQGIQVEAPFSLKAFQLMPCDTLKLTLSDMGWSEKEFEVRRIDLVLTNASGAPTLGVNLQLIETAEGVFDWANGEETTVDLAPNTTLPDPTDIRAPTGLTLESGTDHLFVRGDGTVFAAIYVSWTAPVDPVSASGHYEVQYKRSTSEVWRDAPPVPSGQTSCRILDVKDRERYDVRVRAVSSLGFKSSWTTELFHLVTGKSEAPSTPSGFTAQVGSFGIRLLWEAVSDLDLSHYKITVNSELLVETRGTSYTWDIQVADTYEFDLVAVDTSGNESASPAETTVIIAAPSTPAPAYEIVGPNISITWAAVSAQFAIEEYELRRGASWATSTLVAKIKGTAYSQKVNWTGASTTFWLKARDVAANESAAASLPVTIELPTAVTHLTGDPIDNNVLLKWWAPNVHTLPIEYYRVSKGDTFSASTSIGQVAATFTQTLELEADVYTYWLVPVDTAGNEGPEKDVQVTVLQPPDYVLRVDDTIDPHYCKRVGVLAGQDDERLVAHFVSADETNLRHSNDPTLTIGNDQDFTWVIRFKPTLDSEPQALLSKFLAATATEGEYEVGIDTDDKLYFSVCGGTTQTTKTAAAALTDGQWVTAICWYDHSEQLIYLQYNDVAASSTAHTANINAASVGLAFGRSQVSVGSAYFDGDISFAALWKRVLTSVERQKILDIGPALCRDFFDAGLEADCVSAWDFSEESDGSDAVSREDLIGANDLTDYNTTASAIDDSDYTRTFDLELGELLAPVVLGESWEEHFRRFVEERVSPTLHLRGDVGVTSSSGAVSQWADQSGASRNFSQSTAANKPFITRSDNKENWLINSNDLTASGWADSGVTRPSANRVLANAAAGVRHYCYQSTSTQAMSRYWALNTLVVYEAKFKKDNFRYVCLFDAAGANWNGITLDLDTGTLIGPTNLTAYSVSGPDGDGYYTLRIAFTSSDTTGFTMCIGFGYSGGGGSPPYFETFGTEAFYVKDMSIRRAEADDEYLEATTAPQYRGINGRQVICFDGYNDYLTSTATLADVVDVDSAAVLAVVRFHGFPSGVVQSYFGDSGDRFICYGYSSGPSMRFFHQDADGVDTAAKSTLVAETTHLLSNRHFSGNIVAELDGSAGTPVVSGDCIGGAGTLRIGLFSGQYLTADLAELIVFDVQPSDGDLALVRKLLASWWGSSGDKLTLQDLIDAGYNYLPQPTTTDTCYIERVVDLGATLASSIVTVSWAEDVIDGETTITCEIATSSDGETFSDYQEATSLFATNFRAVKIKLSFAGTDLTALSKLSNLRYKLDVKKTTESGRASASSADSDGTEVEFTQNFLDIEGPPLITPLGIRRAALLRAASSQYLYAADHADFEPGSRDWTIVSLCRLDMKPGGANSFLLSKYGASGTYEYLIYFDYSANRITLAYSADGSTVGKLAADEFGEVPTWVWFQVAFWHENGVGVGLKINDFPADTAASTGGLYAGGADFRIGAKANTSGDLNGAVGNTGIWTRKLSTTELDELFALGFCRKADLSSGLLTSLAAYWEMDEASGTREDETGSHDLSVAGSAGAIILPIMGVADFVDEPNPTSFKALLFTENLLRVSQEFGWSVEGFMDPTA